MTDFLHEGLMPAPTDGPHEWHPSGSAAFSHIRYGHELEPHGWLIPGQKRTSTVAGQAFELSDTSGQKTTEVLSDQAVQAIEARARIADALEGVPARPYDPDLPLRDC